MTTQSFEDAKRTKNVHLDAKGILLKGKGITRGHERRSRFPCAPRGQLKVRFLLPERDPSKQTQTSEQVVPVLPTICEFAAFNSNLRKTKKREAKKDQGSTDVRESFPCWQAVGETDKMRRFSNLRQRKIAPVLPKPTPKCSIQDICDETVKYRVLGDYQVLDTADRMLFWKPLGIRKCSIKELCIDTATRCKMPQDYRDPTRKDTERRIINWLKQSQESLPAYRQRVKTRVR